MTASPAGFPPDFSPGPDTLADRRILVTGASQGIGRAVALACAAAGARVLLLGRDIRRLEQVAGEAAVCGRHEAIIVPMNLEGASLDDYRHVAELIRTQLGALDGLVLNAAMLGELCPIEHYDPVLWARVFQVNVHSQFLLVQACLPLLKAGGSGSVIFTSSGVGRRGRSYWGAYAASKFAVEGLMETLADELASDAGVRVNSVNPGRTRTRMRAMAYPAEDPGTLLPPEAITPLYVWLLAPASAAVHGQRLDAQR